MTKAAQGGAPSRREKRRQAILDAARAVFLEQGYGATSLNDIVSVSGGSLATLYDLFDGKAGLFQEMIEQECEDFFGGLRAEDLDEKPLREALRVVARQFFDGVIQQPKMSLLRVVVAEAPHFPEVGATFYRAGPERGRKMVSAYLGKQSQRGFLEIDDPERAADVFVALIIGEFQMKVLCGEDVRFPPEEVDRYLDYALDVFLKIYEHRRSGSETQDPSKRTGVNRLNAATGAYGSLAFTYDGERLDHFGPCDRKTSAHDYAIWRGRISACLAYSTSWREIAVPSVSHARRTQTRCSTDVVLVRCRNSLAIFDHCFGVATCGYCSCCGGSCGMWWNPLVPV